MDSWGREQRGDCCIDLPCPAPPPPKISGTHPACVGPERRAGRATRSGLEVGEEEATSFLSLCFLPRPWGGQSCPDLAQGQGSTSRVSLKVGENTRVGECREAEALGGAGPALRTLTYKLGNWSSLIPPLPRIHCVTLSRSLPTSEPQLPRLQNGKSNAS